MSKKILYEGKAKQLFETEKPFELVQFFKDDATAFNKKKHEIIDSKGVLNNLISEFIFTYLSNNNIPNHFIERLSPREQLIKKVEIIPIEVVIRNIAAGTFSNRFGIEEGKNLPKTLIEFNLKDDENDDPLVSEEHMKVFGWAKEDEIETMKKYAFEINILLKKLFKKINITLVDFKIEFGRYYTNNNYEIKSDYREIINNYKPNENTSSPKTTIYEATLIIAKRKIHYVTRLQSKRYKIS